MASAIQPLSPRSQAVLEQFQAVKNERHGELMVDQVRRRIAVFERIHGMTSSEMRVELDAESIVETDDICSWLIQLDLLERVSLKR